MSDLYKYAAQNKLTFSSPRGELSVDQLFDLPLTAKSGFDLDTVAKGINFRLKAISDESFVSTSTNPQKPLLEASLEIVKDVIATKKAEAKAAAEKTERAVQRRKLLDAVAAKKDAQLMGASLEDLEKKLAELDG